MFTIASVIISSFIKKKLQFDNCNLPVKILVFPQHIMNHYEVYFLISFRQGVTKKGGTF